MSPHRTFKALTPPTKKPLVPRLLVQSTATKALVCALTSMCLLGWLLTAQGCSQSKPNQLCRQVIDRSFTYSVCSVPNTHKPEQHDAQPAGKLGMYWRENLDTKPFYTFEKLISHLNQRNQTLLFAVNGGMYDSKYAPLAYYVEQGQQIKSLNLLKEGGGNFHLLPNGVFWLDVAGLAHVSESHAFAKQQQNSTVKFATQSGPMLVIDGKLHPKFRKNSESAKMRNGVGVCSDGTVKFVTTDTWVNFYDFAELFKTQLGCNNALFLDGGRASALYAPELGRHDEKLMGVIIGYTETKSKK